MMSLAPQRPNFVLVWIGIILLTFSFISNFLGSPSNEETSALDGRIGLSGIDIFDHPANLPAEFNSDTAFRAAVASSLSTEPAEVDFHPIPGEATNSLAAEATQEIEGAEQIEFEDELLVPAEEPGALSTTGGSALPEQPDSAPNNHSLRSSTASNQSSGNSSGNSSGGSYQSGFGGSNLAHAGGALRRAIKSDPSVEVVTKIAKGSSKRGTLIVSFMLKHPVAAERLQGQAQGLEMSPKVAAKARQYMKSMAAASLEEEVETEGEHSSEASGQSRARKRDLIRMLRLHPGGIEIIAEMTPAHIRELANKLDARSQRPRA